MPCMDMHAQADIPDIAVPEHWRSCCWQANGPGGWVTIGNRVGEGALIGPDPSPTRLSGSTIIPWLRKCSSLGGSRLR